MDIKVEMAPLEGATTATFRQIQSKHFTAADKYYTPFISPTQNHLFTNRELAEILPENNEGLFVVPQLIGHNAEDFLWAAGELKAMGYGEVNLNLGCPSGTVTKKKKGAGLLGDIPLLTEFLDEIFEHSPLPISIKTRIGRKSLDEAETIAKLYSRYPVKELIVHPRLEKDFYKGSISLEAFEIFEKYNKNTVYNGDLFDKKAVEDFSSAHPHIHTVMCGRGFVINPKLAGEIKGDAPITSEEFKAFYSDFFEATVKRLNNDTQVLLHMKEYWAYWKSLFRLNEQDTKKLFKSKSLAEYKISVNGIFGKAAF